MPEGFMKNRIGFGWFRNEQFVSENEVMNWLCFWILILQNLVFRFAIDSFWSWEGRMACRNDWFPSNQLESPSHIPFPSLELAAAVLSELNSTCQSGFSIYKAHRSAFDPARQVLFFICPGAIINWRFDLTNPDRSGTEVLLFHKFHWSIGVWDFKNPIDSVDRHLKPDR